MDNQKGVNGRLFTADNGNSLFLPAASSRWDDEFGIVGDRGYYWSSLLRSTTPSRAWFFYFDSDNYSVVNGYRYYGRSVRAVRSADQN